MERIDTGMKHQYTYNNIMVCCGVMEDIYEIKKTYNYRSTCLIMIMKYYFSDYVNYVKKGQTYTFSVDCTVAGGK